MPASPASTWPLRIRACAPPKVVTLLEPVSSQEASALLLALSAWIQTTRLHVWGPVPSEPFFELTRHVLDPFGARVRTSFEPEVELLALELAQRYPDQAGGERDSLTLSHCLEIHGPLVAPRKEIVIGADAGLGAVALVAGCLSGGRVELDDIGHVSRQPDSAIAERLADFGCDVSWCGNALVGAGRPTRAAAVDLTGAPDLAPLLAVVAAAATRSSGEPSILSGLGSLRHKESDRLEGLAHLLRSAGFAAEVHVDALFVGPESEARGSGPLLVDPRGDHRMAYAGALLGLLVPDVLVTDPGCVRKTWPAFWDELEALGAVTVRG